MWLQISTLISLLSIGYTQIHSNYSYIRETNSTCGSGSECLSQSVNMFSNINEHNLISSSVIYGLLTMASKTNLSGKCFNHMQSIYDAIHRQEIWAMKVLDSSAKSQPGFVWGNNFWLGSIKGCAAVNAPILITLSNRFPRDMKPNLLNSKAPFEIDYRIAYAKHRSPWQIQVEFLLTEKILHLGMCLPTSCSDTEIFHLTQKYLDSHLLGAHNIFEHQPEVVHVKNLKLKMDFFQKTSVKIVGIFLMFTMLIIGLSAIYDYHNNMGTVKCEINNNADASSTNGTIVSNQYNTIILKNGCSFQHNNCGFVQEKEKSIFVKILKCFSVIENFKSISSTSVSADALPIINGFKSLGCFFILVFHMHWFSHFTVHNPAMMFAYGEQALWQWVSTTPIIVDVFFTISGLLLSYNFLRNKLNMQNIKNNNFKQNFKLFAKQLLHRYIRLSPLYLVVIGITEISTTYLVETSPFWIQERYDIVCQKYWWRNVFYIQNLFPVKDLCVNWSWSMACEMQFYIIFSALLFLYAKNPKMAKDIFLTAFCGFFVIIFAIAYQSKFTPAYDVMHELGKDLYIAPWSRILPYFIGVGAGWALLLNKNGLPLSQKSIRLIWTISTTIAIMSHLSTINRDISHIWAAPLITGIRVFYSSSVAWMIVASALGHGGWLTKVMQFRAFVHLNKLSYGIYLLNPVVISWIYGSKDHSTHIDPISSIIMSIGVMVVVYLMAFVFSIMFELPYTNLSALILRGNKRKIS